ncbi:MAG: hypothetical protein JSR46_12280 [Verrucomicrobia bacterium]|nr:hypothetical protein [Verrucomicrobiota bacterium]
MEIVELIETLDRSYMELKEGTSIPEVNEIQRLFEKVSDVHQQVEQKIESTVSLLRPITRMYEKRFGSLHKIEIMEQQITDLLDEAKTYHHQQRINKKLWELQRKGLLSPGDSETAAGELCSYETQMRAVNCGSAFVLLVVSKEEGLLELTVFSLDPHGVTKYQIDINSAFQIEDKSFDTIEEALAVYAPLGLPLNQLQDIASWFENHATGEYKISHILSTSAIEQKLSDLLKTCPQGAYILHPGDQTAKNSLKLSRIHQKGKIHHLTVDLAKRLGYYTISDEQGKLACQTRLQFRRSLDQMGMPLRLRVPDGG